MMIEKTDTPHAEQGINWSEIHQRLEIARQALSQETTSSEKENLATLKKRACLLAREIQQVDASMEFLDVVEFRMATETYGLESAFVREVYPFKDFTPLPGVPPFVLGIINVRGQILSIIDLKKFFDLPENGLGQLNKLIILRDGAMEFGVLADEILGARAIPLMTVQAAPPTISGIGAEYLRGVTAEQLIILDAQKILNDERIIVHQQAS
jgi:purine-binding chemotaxis protein CheW